MTAVQVERILMSYGFQLVSQRGSHRKWRNDSRNLQVIVPLHGSQTLPIGTMRAIMLGAEIPDTEWKTP